MLISADFACRITHESAEVRDIIGGHVHAALVGGDSSTSTG